MIQRGSEPMRRSAAKAGSQRSVVVSVFHARSQLSKACLTLLVGCVRECVREREGVGPDKRAYSKCYCTAFQKHPLSLWLTGSHWYVKTLFLLHLCVHVLSWPRLQSYFDATQAVSTHSLFQKSRKKHVDCMRQIGSDNTTYNSSLICAWSKSQWKFAEATARTAFLFL